MNNPALVIMAAGMGSRFGGFKQVQPVGPNNQIILDYSVYDAIRAGFNKVVFVIGKQLETIFVEDVLPRYASKICAEIVLQELNDIPPAFMVPASRQKPWGTGHALMMAEKAISSNFCVINADDFYGYPAFMDMAVYLSGTDPETAHYAMTGYSLVKTLSPAGSVSRGICDVDGGGFLRKIAEYTNIRQRDGEINAVRGERIVSMDPNTIVSMNCWGFTPGIFEALRNKFNVFLEHRIADPGSEFQLPGVVDKLLTNDGVSVRVLDSKSDWFGITYQEDLSNARAIIRQKTKNGEYPDNLWS